MDAQNFLTIPDQESKKCRIFKVSKNSTREVACIDDLFSALKFSFKLERITKNIHYVVDHEGKEYYSNLEGSGFLS